MEKNKNIISVSGLSKIYQAGDTAVTALDRIDLDVDSGEFLMITGRNGSGKSTLMHLLALLDKPSSGEIMINDLKTSHLSEGKKMHIRLHELGYVFQEYALVAELSVLENIMLPAMMLSKSKDAKKKALALLEKVNLGNKIYRLPSQLSGGEQQKVAIARALINSPKILFADEPTANLDSIASVDVLNIFKALNLNDGITIIMVTHEPEELTYSTRQINLKDGRIE